MPTGRRCKPILPPAWDEKKYGNPEYGGNFQTSASASVHGYFKGLRIAGAQARRVLLDAVAAKWNVPVAELTTEPSVVVHKASGRRMSYGEIAAFAKAPAELPKIEDKDLKPAASFRLIGKDVPRVELPTKVTGAATYAMDVQVPGMVYAAVLQSPYPHGAPETVDDTAARKVPGITDVVRLPDGVGGHRRHGRGDAGRQEAAQGHLVECGGREPRQRARARRVCRGRPRPQPRGRALRDQGRRQGRHAPAPPRCSAATTARATSITRRWSP